jgi:predicted lipid-binding transport protein (Tim44 family)
MFEIYAIIFVVVAVFVHLRLRKEFSRSTGRERPLQLTSEASDRYGGIAMPGSRSPKGSKPSWRRTKISTSSIAGAEAAYEMIVTVYMEGDRRKLTNLLAPK